MWEQGALSDLSLRNFLILKETGHIFELPKSKEALLKAKAEMQSVPAEQCSVRGLRGGATAGTFDISLVAIWLQRQLIDCVLAWFWANQRSL